MESFFSFLEKRVDDCSSLLCIGWINFENLQKDNFVFLCPICDDAVDDRCSNSFILKIWMNFDLRGMTITNALKHRHFWVHSPRILNI